MPWSNFVTDKFIAPEMSQFTSATLPDLSAIDSEQEFWLANYILNSILRVNIQSPERQRLFNFLRRSHSAFEEYSREPTFLQEMSCAHAVRCKMSPHPNVGGLPRILQNTDREKLALPYS